MENKTVYTFQFSSRILLFYPKPTFFVGKISTNCPQGQNIGFVCLSDIFSRFFLLFLNIEKEQIQMIELSTLQGHWEGALKSWWKFFEIQLFQVNICFWTILLKLYN